MTTSLLEDDSVFREELAFCSFSTSSSLSNITSNISKRVDSLSSLPVQGNEDIRAPAQLISSALGVGGSCGCLSRQMQRLPSSGAGNPNFLHRIFVMRLLCAVDAVE